MKFIDRKRHPTLRKQTFVPIKYHFSILNNSFLLYIYIINSSTIIIY